MPIDLRKMADTISVDRIVNFEIPTPAPDGSTTVFTTLDAKAYEAGTMQLFRDQLTLQGGGVDFTETTPNSGVFTVVSAPDADEVLWSRYIKQ